MSTSEKKPSGCIAHARDRQLASIQTLQGRETCAYVDYILTSHNSLDHLKLLTSNIEQILKAGGFLRMPWVYSGQSERKGQKGEVMKSKTMILSNQLIEENNKALGLVYTIECDQLQVMVVVNLSMKKKKCALVRTY